jgi:anaphase-promoting complex subunit 4
MIDPSELPGGGEGASVEAGGGTVARPRPPPGCVPEAGVLDASAARARRLPGLVATAPLAVGPAKGLAAVLVGSRRIVLLDLEEDECDEDDDEEEE